MRGRTERSDFSCRCAHACDPPLRMRVASPSRCWIIASDSALSKSESSASTQPSWALAIRKNCDALLSDFDSAESEAMIQHLDGLATRIRNGGSHARAHLQEKSLRSVRPRMS